MTRRFIKAIIPYLKQVRGLLLFGSFGGIVMNTTVVLPAILLGRTIDTAMAWSEGQASSSDVLWAGLAYTGAMALYQSARLVKRWGLRIGNQRIMASLRADALRGVLAWPMVKLYQYPIGDLMARVIGDVQVVFRGVHELDTEIWDTVLFSLSLTAGMLVYDPTLTLLALLPAPLGMLLARAVERWVSARTTASREASAALTAFLQEHLSGLRVVRLFGRREATVARAAGLSDQLAKANLALIRLRSGLLPVYTMLMMAGIVFVIWLGGERVATGVMSLGAFIAYLDLYRRFVGRGHRIPQLFNSVQSAVAAYARLEPLLAPPYTGQEPRFSSIRISHIPGIDQPIPPLPPRPEGPLSLTLQGVTFRYPGSDAALVDNVSLEIPAGSLVAVTGPVGSGKSALARALLGLYPLAGGRVLLDGQPLDRLSPSERAACIGYLPQTPFLFSGAVCDNILLDPSGAGPDGEEALDRCVELAALAEDVQGFPDGIDTEIGERGVRVSGGQRQRIALARAFATNPGLLVLDDPFSAVDVDTEARIIAGLLEAFGPAAPLEQRATIVFFSHRLAAFPLSDRVVVLDGGRIVEQGTHGELLQTPSLYARIYRAQQHVGSRGGVTEELG
jgi:ABC-type multidrug transport system fused ATPase/permease subunit